MQQLTNAHSIYTMITNPTSEGLGSEFSMVRLGAPPSWICSFILAFLALLMFPKVNSIGVFGERKDFIVLVL